MKNSAPKFRRVAVRSGRQISLTFDGVPLTATEGDSVLAALLAHRGHVREHEFAREHRAGFCLMGACQDCFVWSADTGYIRACTTFVADGMTLFAAPKVTSAND